MVCYSNSAILHDDLRFTVSQTRQHFDLPIARVGKESQFRYLTSRILFSLRIFAKQNQMYDVVCTPHETLSPENCVGHPPRPEPRRQIWIRNIHSAESNGIKNFRTKSFSFLCVPLSDSSTQSQMDDPNPAP